MLISKLIHSIKGKRIFNKLTSDKDPITARFVEFVQDLPVDGASMSSDNIELFCHTDFGSDISIKYDVKSHTIYSADIVIHFDEQMEAADANDVDDPARLFELSYGQIYYCLREIRREFTSDEIRFNLHHPEDFFEGPIPDVDDPVSPSTPSNDA